MSFTRARSAPGRARPRGRTVRLAGLLTAVVALTLAGAGPTLAVGGGTAAADGSFPFVAKVDIGAPGEGRSCTGTLLSPAWVATAAACFLEPGRTTVPFGAPATAATVTVGRTDLATTGGHVVPVTELVPHRDRDIVLARLAIPVTDITPVTVAATPPGQSDVLTVAGFGRTRNEWITNRLHTAAYTVSTVSGTTVDIAPQTPADSSLCRGDAGGPALRQTGGRWELVGLHHSSGQVGCLGSTSTSPSAVEVRLDDLQGWLANYLQGGTVALRNGVSGKCLETNDNAGANEAPIQQWTCGDQPAARWDLELIGSNGADPVYRMRHHAHPAKCIEIPDASPANGAVAQLWDCGDQPTAQWIWRPLGAGRYNVVNAQTGKCLEMNNATTDNGAKAQQWTCGGQAAATWHRDETTTLRNAVSGKCLETDNNAGANEARIQQWDCGGQAAARWDLELVGSNGADPVYRMRHHAHPAKCIEIPDA
ncbi:RICIN domain-containing protein, partial [Actinoplanes philippinensis]|uniref:RICIN domain-containing protein n=1 Tax=Actinoplanes philippinensis TaxID=35752 RepID=UPI0033CF38B3